MRFYTMKYRLPMSHSSSGKIENEHHHILEVEVQAKMEGDAADSPQNTEKTDVAEATRMERVLQECLEGYRNRYLNGMDEFGGDASIENITEVFYQKLAKAFYENGWMLARVEVGENPLRVCIIGNRNL